MVTLNRDKTANEKLVALLDYVEQVVRLDERTAFALTDYRLGDRTRIALPDTALRGLPGIAFDTRDEDGPVWLRVERLARRDPPSPSAPLLPWLIVGPDPGAVPAIRGERLETVSAEARNALLAAGEADREDFAELPAGPGEAPRFDRRLALSPASRAEAEAWIAGPFRDWSVEEGERRRTIAAYGLLYKLQQQLELGGAESAVEAVWGIGPVLWVTEERRIERPLIERAVELDLEPDGAIAVRPRDAPARFDLKPFEEVGCTGLAALDALLREGLARAGEEDEGVSPWRPDMVAPLLEAAATRLAPNGRYVAGLAPAPGTAPGTAHDGPLVTDGWVLFARPRSQHVALDDIARLRTLAGSGVELSGLAARLVTPPNEAPDAAWAPLGATLGAMAEPAPAPEAAAVTDVFFPKPFNEDQVAIVRRLAATDGLVVQGPPGTGKTHTIANIVCHAMALGQRVLVLSRGEAALAVLRDLLPEKVRPLVIAILSSERAGLKQVETAIREIQSVVEESRPEIRQSAIRRCEAEILKIRARLGAIDAELDAIAVRQTEPLGPRKAAPADLARALGAEPGRHGWFTDRPAPFAAECGLDDAIEALRAGRRAAGDWLDHRDTALPDLETLPDDAVVASWHEDLVRARALEDAAGPAGAMRLAPGGTVEAARGAKALRDLAGAWEDALREPWLHPLLAGAAAAEPSPWLDLLRDIAAEFWIVEAERARLAPFAVDLPERLLDDEAGRQAIARAAAGERPWSRLSLGRSAAKDLVAEVRVRGLPPADAVHWGAVVEAMALQERRAALGARWRAFAGEAGVPPGQETAGPGPAARALAALDRAGAALPFLGAAERDRPSLAALAADPDLARALAAQVEGAVLAARLAAADSARHAAADRFAGPDRTSAMARRFFAELVGRHDLDATRIAALWRALTERIGAVAALHSAFAAIRDGTARIAAAGAPDWAARLGGEPPDDEDDALLPADWHEAWDRGAAAFHLARIDGRARLLALSREREAADRRGAKLFTELVRERAFLSLERRLSPRVKSALVEYVRALGRLGKGTGKGAGRHRRAVREAMQRCCDAVPCWIMPTWRVAEQLPADLSAFDLVILDEASQSDVTELPALLRGRKILCVGDDRQVSPTAPFVTLARLDQLRRHHLQGLPFAGLLEPGESLYDLMRAVYPDSRIMLKEHFRCVEPIIRFSMAFYPETLLPLRIPAAAERLDPPLVDIHVPHGAREGARKINRAEAQVIVDEIAGLTASEGPPRSIGVISLIGGEQAELVRVMLSERIGEEAMQRHRILCGDSAAFQGNERDIVFLSMVADSRNRATLTMLRYEQRFNVAASRARDRLVLVRSIRLQDLNPLDLRARLIAHFDAPLPARPDRGGDPLAACESGFERDVMAALLARRYRVEPQVGSEGFRIDLVVEGEGGRRLAVECDGDSFHGPERWRDDMRRQRILERVGWRFWRCFASNFYRDPEGVLSELVDTLAEAGIAPLDEAGGHAGPGLVTERRVAAPPPPLTEAASAEADPVMEDAATTEDAAGPGGIKVGDRVALVFADRKRLTLRLTEGASDESRGLVGRDTPLGRALDGAGEGDEIALPPGHGGPTALVEAVRQT